MKFAPDKTEDMNQILLVNYIKKAYPDTYPLWHHSPNGGSRSASEAGTPSSRRLPSIPGALS